MVKLIVLSAMGIRGLLKFLRTHPKSRCRYLSLTETCASAGKSIVCDFHSVIMELLKLFHRSKVRNKDYSPHSYVYGADYDDYSKRIEEFVNALRSLGVEPVFFVDGPRCSNSSDLQFKLKTWICRQSQSDAITKRFQQYCAYDSRNCGIEQTWTVKCLLHEQILQTLRKNEVMVKICIGEADYFMAKYVKTHKEVCGIISNDTDLSMMANCGSIPINLFDRDDNMKLGRSVINETPCIIRYEKINPNKIASCLNIEPDCLPALSILCGNDYTSYIAQEKEVREIMNFAYPIVESVASWMQGKKCSNIDEFLSNPEISRIVNYHPEYPEVAGYVYKMYLNLELPADVTADDSVSNRKELIQHILEGDMNGKLLSIINCSVYWRTHIEQFECTASSPCVDERLLPVRKMIYSLLCLNIVTEYGQFVKECGEQITVTPLPPILLTEIRHLLSQQQKMLAVYGVLTQDPDFVTVPEMLCHAILTKFPTLKLEAGEKLDFHSVLIYACLVEAVKTKVISTDSLVPLILTLLCTSIKQRSKKLILRPNCKAVTCSSQFTSILEHAYILSSLFNLHCMLPLPSQLFKAQMYISFYMVGFVIKSRCRGQDRELQELYKELVRTLTIRDDKPLRLLKCMIDTITKGGIENMVLFQKTFATSKTELESVLHGLYANTPTVITIQSKKKREAFKLNYVGPPHSIMGNVCKASKHKVAKKKRKKLAMKCKKIEDFTRLKIPQDFWD